MLVMKRLVRSKILVFKLLNVLVSLIFFLTSPLPERAMLGSVLNSVIRTSMGLMMYQRYRKYTAVALRMVVLHTETLTPVQALATFTDEAWCKLKDSYCSLFQLIIQLFSVFTQAMLSSYFSSVQLLCKHLIDFKSLISFLAIEWKW